MKYALALPSPSPSVPSSQANCEYSLVVSPRAKYIRIKISQTGDIKVVVPKGVDARYAHDFVEQKKDWIAKALEKIERVPSPEIVIPETLKLNLTGESWQIEYQATDYKGVSLTQQSDQQLLIEGAIEEKELIFSVLEQWLKAKAKTLFPAKLDELSDAFSLPYQRLTIRGQKTRWGSCSSKQSINLNYKLLFFPEAVVRYVFIHELCHTKEMNHSQHFWSLVERCDPDYKEHRHILKKASDFIPAGF